MRTFEYPEHIRNVQFFEWYPLLVRMIVLIKIGDDVKHLLFHDLFKGNSHMPFFTSV